MLDLLYQAISKQQELHNDPRWNVELLPFAPPVLWFGDIRSNLPKTVTIGANPSRREFLENAVANPNNYQNYFVGKLPRFYVFENPIYELNIIGDETLDEIIKSYNNYFANSPYKTWFGKPNGGKVEALMNGLNGSFFNDNMTNRGIHIDLFPFTTLKDFKKIEELCYETLFQTNWAQNFLIELISRIKPDKLIVFGISNYKSIHSILNLNKVLPVDYNFEDRFCSLYFDHIDFNHLNIPLIGISINLGNPHGWTRNHLIQLGEYINNNL